MQGRPVIPILLDQLEPGAHAGTGASSLLVQLENQPRTGLLFHNQSWLQSHDIMSLYMSLLSTTTATGDYVCATVAPGFGMLHQHPNTTSDSKKKKNFNVDCLCLYFHSLHKGLTSLKIVSETALRLSNLV